MCTEPLVKLTNDKPPPPHPNLRGTITLWRRERERKKRTNTLKLLKPISGLPAGLHHPLTPTHPESLRGIQVGAEVSDFQAEQLHVEDEGGVRWDDAWVSFGAVSKV